MKKIGAFLSASVVCLAGNLLAAVPQSVTDFCTDMEADASLYTTKIIETITVVALLSLGIAAVFALFRWIKRLLVGRG